MPNNDCIYRENDGCRITFNNRCIGEDCGGYISNNTSINCIFNHINGCSHPSCRPGTCDGRCNNYKINDCTYHGLNDACSAPEEPMFCKFPRCTSYTRRTIINRTITMGEYNTTAYYSSDGMNRVPYVEHHIRFSNQCHFNINNECIIRHISCESCNITNCNLFLTQCYNRSNCNNNGEICNKDCSNYIAYGSDDICKYVRPYDMKCLGTTSSLICIGCNAYRKKSHINTLKCDVCGNLIDLTKVDTYEIIKGKVYHKNCIKTCPTCRNKCINIIEFNHNLYCENCMDEHNIYRCERCGNYTSNITTHNINSRIIKLCNHCSEIYIPCNECGRIINIHPRNMGDDTYYYCGDHLPRHRTNYIHNYSYKPTPLFKISNSEKNNKNNIFNFYGLELELDGGSPQHIFASKLIELSDNDKLFYLKYDSSLSNEGIELVTHPATLNYHLEHFPYKEILNLANIYHYNSHNTTTCGLHIHASLSNFGNNLDEANQTITKLIYILDQHWDNIMIISRRNPGEVERFASKYNLSGIQVREMLSKNHHHMCISVNKNTVELRLFKGTLRPSSIYAAIEIYDKLIKLSKNLTNSSIRKLNWNNIYNDIITDTRYVKNYIDNII